MDQKKKWMLMVGMLGFTFIWMQVVLPYLRHKYNWKDERTAEKPAVPANVDPQGPASSSQPAPNATSAPVSQPVAEVKGAATVSELVLGSTEFDPDLKKPKSPFPLGVTLSSRGAAVESVALNRYRQQYDQTKPYVFQQRYAAPSAAVAPLTASLATRWVSIAGVGQQNLDNVNWAVVPPSSSAPAGAKRSASFSVDLNDIEGKARLRIIKTFEIRDKDDKTAGYEMLVKYELKNLTDQPLKAKLAYNGTNVPRSEHNRDTQEVVAGFDGGRQNVNVNHAPVGGIAVDKPVDILAMNKDEPLLWSGMSSAYFDAIVRPTGSGGARFPIASAKAVLLNPDEKDSLKHDVALNFETGDIDLPAGGAAGFELNVYVGPKLRDVINNDYYAVFPMSYDETLVLRTLSGFGAICGFCTRPELIGILVRLLKGFHSVFRDWGLAIIALVCLVRLILHPITKKSQVSMSRMTKMGPEMERLKAKHKDDPDALKKAQMEFYREQGVAPILGCLPMFLQMPIWIALWSSLQSTFEIRHASFLWNLTWIKDLSQPDRLVAFHQPFQMWFIHLDAINILPVLMAVMFYVQQKFQPQPVAATPEQQQQQKMMKWMSIFLFPLFLYGQPSGLNLYIFTSTLIGIVESKRIRDHIKEADERAKQGVVIVDGDPVKRPELAGGAVRRANPKKDVTDKPLRGIAGFMAKLQQMAEEAKREQEKQQKKGKK
jgi:YidC/Oxa1 family membrane protein insertase